MKKENRKMKDETIESTWGIFQKELQDMKDYPSVEAVLNATHELAPEGWIVTDEYPNQIGVHHPTLTDDQFISFGDVNGYFAFNDAFNDGANGSMEDLTDAQDIAESFWQQIAKIYPDLVKGE
jgi:hypothetical protein